MKISSYSFNECQNLKEISFLNDSNLEIIDDYSFSYSSLQTLTIPSTVAQIGSHAFTACRKFHAVDFMSNSKLLSIEKYAFSYTSIEYISFYIKTFKIVNKISINQHLFLEFI